jgi:hypothetical protein
MVLASSRYLQGHFRLLDILLGDLPFGWSARRLLEKRPRLQPRLEALEERTLLSVNLVNSFTGLGENGTAADTCGAAGTTSSSKPCRGP